MTNQFSILEIASALGSQKTSPALLFEDDDGRIAKKTGISNIHRSQGSAFQLASEAVASLKDLDLVREDVRYVIYVTQSPSYFLPNHASRLQSEFGLPASCMAFDINQGCSGFVQALVTMISLFQAENEVGLIVCADTYSAHMARDDRSTQVLFSDGATATLVRSGGDISLQSALHLTDGSGADLLVKSVDEKERLAMDGAAVFHWTRNALGPQIEKCLVAEGISCSDVDYFILHQASKLVLDNVKRSLGLNDDSVPTTLSITGNLVSSSIPFLLQKHPKCLGSGNRLVMAGFGVGLSCSVCLLEVAP